MSSIKFSQLAASGGIFSNSCFGCHNATNPKGSLDLTNYAAAKLAAINIKSRVNNPNNPMPTGGLLPQVQRDTISAWVDQGAPQ
jgi:mono/diheme cytochrome c family protein